MSTLFPHDSPYPPGFYYFPDFLGASEEAELLEVIARIELNTFVFQGFEAKRRVAGFGVDYSFESRSISQGKEIPPAFHGLIEKVSHQIQIPAADFQELLITEYPTGSVINWHRDAPPFDVIVGISLATDCTFRFRPHDKEKQSRRGVIALPVLRRSMYVIQGTARTDWQHSITPVKAMRYSITLRTIRIN
jgi:alkylated DNA repair dioxygenase AlkB